MKKTISIILSLILILALQPLTAIAADSTVLTVTERYTDGNELSWNTLNTEYDGTVIEKSTDGASWTEENDIMGGSYDGYYVNTAPKTVCYYRVTCYNNVYNEETYNYDRVYAQPSNTVEVYSVFDDFYSYSECFSEKAILYWYISKDYKKYIDGVDIFTAVNSADEKLKTTVKADSYTDKNPYEFIYQYKIKNLPKYVYQLKYIFKPYFMFNGKKYYINAGEERNSVTYVSKKLAKVTSKRKVITLKIKEIEGIKRFKIQYTKYNLKTGKTYKTKTKTTATLKNTFKTDTKDYGYFFEVFPVINGETLEGGCSIDSHEAHTLLNSVSRKKAKPIKVINTRGSKPYTDWTYKLTSQDKKTIKKFFYKKYKGKNPSRAEMAEYALNWINKKVDYDYDYKYGNLRYVDAIFNKRKGQCLQYNGAFAAVLTYLGYEARVIEGYRTDSSGKPVVNHFWCEVKLNGRWYLCETGNYGKNGPWQHFVRLYRDAGGYTKYGKPAKD